MELSDGFDAPSGGGQPEPKRDRWGRYMLPEPAGGKAVAWTRATTFAKSISDTFGLTKWQLRMAVKGVATRQDLRAMAAAANVEDKKTLDQVATDAMEAAGSASGRNQGTALHSFTEAHDRGERPVVPAPWNTDVAAYARSLDSAGITVVPEWIERIVIVPELKVAGTFDRILRLPGGEFVIGDVKTGKDLSYGWLEISVQLALYAHAEVMWNGITDAYEPMPAVNRERAVVMHLPVGTGRCDLYEVDIAAGWEAAQLCADVRSWRARRDLAAKLDTWTAPEPSLEQAIAAASYPQELVDLWISGTAKSVWTPAHTQAAAVRKAQLLAGRQ